jgi:hypothetical protein
VAHKEACQVYIEQEIKDGLAQGKTPYSIDKDLSAWVEKLFETSISPETLKSRAARIQKQNGSNEPTPSTTTNPSEIPQKPAIQQVRSESGKFERGTSPGPGRAPKYAPLKPFLSLN